MKNNALMMMKRNIPIVLSGMICLIFLIVILFLPGNKKESRPVELSEYSSISDICELATLRSYYHNVAMYEEEPEGAAKVISDILTWPFNQLLKTGYKQFWLEYSGIVEIGVDLKTDKIQINNPDASGVVNVYVPDAKVLNVDANENSFSDPLDETGLFTTITAKERSDTYAEAQDAMRQEAENDQALLGRAKNNAKILLERYIVNLGKAMGVDYTINWVDNSW
ncbi:MAG: DUF4230 domain-containing protein [Candidatus Limiplasma sp.]|nr:DUF4230 domain-containing protein [Candidatus Limiplasma sp.]